MTYCKGTINNALKKCENDIQKESMREEAILKEIERRRNRNERMVFTNGCFDLLHVGHIRYLTAARALGDFLVVGLNSDASVQRLKGPSRPIVPEAERREVLLALRAVDCVCIFSEDTPLTLIQQIKPQILVKGGDWPVDKIVGSQFVQSYGGQVLSLAFVEGKSTSNLITRIQSQP